MIDILKNIIDFLIFSVICFAGYYFVLAVQKNYIEKKRKEWKRKNIKIN